MRWLSFLLFFSCLSITARGNVLPKDLISDFELAREATSVLGNLGLNCGNNPANIAIFKEEYYKFMGSLGKVLTSSVAQLGLKKEYPTACHVLTQNQIESYTEGQSEKKWNECIVSTRFGCKLRAYYSQTTPDPSYYWPLYFIEVTEKGNDYHPSFAKENTLYTANRKIASSLRNLIDQNGALSITRKVLTAQTFASLTPFNLGSPDWESYAKAEILTPFERLRIRADQSKGNVSFDAAVWPVALSKVLAENFSVCKKGGYGWPLDNIPQTCPVALSSDAYAYWDTGMLDYLDPSAIASMASSSNPVSCMGEQVYRSFDNSQSGKRGPLGSQTQVTGALSKLRDKMQNSLKTCSWPVLGDAEAITKKAVSMTDTMKWQGPYCTMWGSLAPRMSTNLVESDYSYANKALQFKLFAHEMFSIPRGSQERWSLAYPWEDGSTSLTEGNLSDAFSKLTDISKIKDVFGRFDLNGKPEIGSSESKYRSEALLPPGHPLMVNASYSRKYLTDRISSHAKEGVYLASLVYGATKAGEAAKKEYLDRYGSDAQVESPYEEMVQGGILDQELNDAEKRTAEVAEEAVYKEVHYCHISKERDGTVMGSSNHRFYLDGFGHLDFEKVASIEDCFKTVNGRCLKKGWSRKGRVCKRRQDIWQVGLIRQEVSHYRKVANPKVYKVSEPSRTHYRSWSTPNTNKTISSYKTDLRLIGQKDTRKKTDRPSSNDPKTSVGDNETAQVIQNLATSSAWVSAEVARQKWAEILGNNPVPGDRRIYTIWEKVGCQPKFNRTDVHIGPVGYSWYSSCREAIRFEVIKFIHTKLLRRICDGFAQEPGKPWK